MIAVSSHWIWFLNMKWWPCQHVSPVLVAVLYLYEIWLSSLFHCRTNATCLYRPRLDIVSSLWSQECAVLLLHLILLLSPFHCSCFWSSPQVYLYHLFSSFALSVLSLLSLFLFLVLYLAHSHPPVACCDITPTPGLLRSSRILWLWPRKWRSSRDLSLIRSKWCKEMSKEILTMAIPSDFIFKSQFRINDP